MVVSASLMGHWVSEEARRKIGEANRKSWQRKQGDETCLTNVVV